MGAQGSQGSISFKKETTWNVAATGQYAGINFESEDMVYDMELRRSKNVRPDRQTGSVVPAKAMVTGGIKSEFIISNLNGLLPGCLWDTDWHTVVQSASTVAFTAEAGAGLGGTAVVSALCAASLSAGMFLFLSGAPNALNRGLHRVKSVVGTTVTFDEPMFTESGVTLVIKGDYVRNGKTQSSYSIEKALTDVNEYFLYTGMVPSETEFIIEAEEAVFCNVSFVGGNEVASGVTSSSPAASTPTTDPVVTSGLNVASILIAGLAASACLVKSVSAKIDNKAEGRSAVGTAASCSVSGKSIEAGGKITLFFNDSTYYDKYKAVTSFGLAIYMLDANSKGFVVYLPKCYFSKAPVNITGNEDDVLLEGEYIAIVGDDGFTAQLSKFV